MKIFGNSIEIQIIWYKLTYGDWYFENEVVFEQFLNLKREDFTVDEFTLQFRELLDICELEEDAIHDLDRYVRGLIVDIVENLNYCKTIQDAYLEALRVERMLRRSRMQQFRQRAHVVERLFVGEDNLTLAIRRLLNTNEKEEEGWS